METTKSIELIETMMQESKESLHRNSFYYILWGILLIPAGIGEYFLQGTEYVWITWPIVSTIGGIVSGVYGARESRRTGTATIGDRITKYIWGTFVGSMAFVLIYSLALHTTPHALILLLAGGATFMSGGISRFTPFIVGGIALVVAGAVCGFLVGVELRGLVFSAGILLGYVIPGFMLRNTGK